MPPCWWPKDPRRPWTDGSGLHAGQADERRRRRRRGGGGGLHRLAAVAGQLGDDVRQERRLVAAVLGHRLQGARQQVGGVGLHHQPVRRDVLHQLAQVRAAALVAQPAGDADMPVPVEVVEQLLAGAGEAVHHRRPGPALEVLHHRHEVGVGVALVQEQRLGISGRRQVRADLQLALECLALGRAWREVAEVVQPALAHRHHFRVRVQRAHFGVAFLGVFDRVVRVHPGGGVEHARMRLRQPQGQRRMLAAGAGDHHPRHPGLAGAGQDRVAVAVEAFVGEVGADVDQVHALREAMEEPLL